MLKLKTLTLGALLAAAAAGAMARPMDRHEPAPQVDARQARQEARIETALHEGRLNRREYRTLQREQASIRRFEAQARADGVVTRSERRTLDEMLDRASRNIRRAAA